MLHVLRDARHLTGGRSRGLRRGRHRLLDGRALQGRHGRAPAVHAVAGRVVAGVVVAAGARVPGSPRVLAVVKGQEDKEVED